MKTLFALTLAFFPALLAALEVVDVPGAIRPINLRCEYMDNPLGIDVVRPRLSWTLDALTPEQRGLRQEAYRILVASSPERLARDEGDLWDSGKVRSSQSNQLVYGGRELRSLDACHWKVRVWDGEDRPSPWSEPASWSMGLLQPSDWSGRWIAAPREVSGEDGITLPLLRKPFVLDKPVRSASLHVSSLGYHRIALNGETIGNHEFDPVQSDYSRRAYYVTHDVARNLRQGGNVSIWQYLGDWASPRRPQDTLPCNGHWTSKEQNQVFNNLHYHLQLVLASRIANILGHAIDAANYEAKAQALRQKINSAYFDPETATYTRGEQQQTCLAFPLLQDIVPARDRNRVWQNLLDDITKRRGGHLDFGVLGGNITLALLIREGRSDLIHRMATQPSWPGWGHLLDQGATTLWEHWLPGDSSIHNSFLSIGEWFFSGLAGISPDPDCPGFRRFRLHPQPVPGLEWANATYQSPCGLISTGWRREGHRLVFDFQIPPSTTAIVRLPAGHAGQVQEKGRSLTEAVGIRMLPMAREALEWELASGTYRFVVDPETEPSPAP